MPGIDGPARVVEEVGVDGSRLAALTQAGVSVWLDDLSRSRIRSGSLGSLIDEQAVVGVTSNPTILGAAITSDAAYLDEMAGAARRGLSGPEIVRQLAVSDVQAACDLFARVSAATDGVDGRVSLEVDPAVAHDHRATVEDAVRLHRAAGRPNLLIKIPATTAGLRAIPEVMAEGIDVNVTLVFSVLRYRQVLDAYLAGLERIAAQGLPLTGVHSVASVFVSRVDTEVDRRLTEIGTTDARALRGLAGVANCRLVHRAFDEVLAGPRWERLRGLGARPQRLLWASTGVKDPDHRDTRYIEELVAPGTVSTMPEDTLRAFADHGVLPDGGDALSGQAAAAQRLLDAVCAAGVDLGDVFTVLERDGVSRFARSWAGVHRAVERAVGGTGRATT